MLPISYEAYELLVSLETTSYDPETGRWCWVHWTWPFWDADLLEELASAGLVEWSDMMTGKPLWACRPTPDARYWLQT